MYIRAKEKERVRKNPLQVGIDHESMLNPSLSFLKIRSNVWGSQEMNWEGLFVLLLLFSETQCVVVMGLVLIVDV